MKFGHIWYFEYPDLEINVKDSIYEKFTTCLAQIGPKIKSTQNLLKFGKFNISNMPISILMSKMVFMKYILLGLNWCQNKKMLKIYRNLAHLIFRISQSQFWCQKLISLNTYHFFGPNWSQNVKCSEFIEIWHIRYFKYANLDFEFKNGFYELFTSCQAKLTPRLKLLWNVCLIFQVFQSWLRDLIIVSVNNYNMLCQN